MYGFLIAVGVVCAIAIVWRLWIQDLNAQIDADHEDEVLKADDY